MVALSSPMSTATPRERRMSAVICTSPTSGADRITLGPSPRTAATMCFVTAFLEPRTETSPRRGPEGSTAHARSAMSGQAYGVRPRRCLVCTGRGAVRPTLTPMASGDGILSGPIDLDGPRRPRSQHPIVPATPGLAVVQRGTHVAGVIVGMANGAALVRDHRGVEHRMALLLGGFEVEGRTVTLVEPRRS